MAKCKNKILHVKKIITRTSCVWETFYKGDEVPENWRGLFVAQGGQFQVEEKPVEEVPKGAKANVDGKDMRYDEKKEEWKEEVWTEKKLFAENKKKQVELLKELGAEKVPRYEKGRVKLILELQDK